MRKALYERFGLGQPDPKPRPVIGSRHITGGFVVPALLGVAPLGRSSGNFPSHRAASNYDA
jgi:hypothetical protein